MNSCPCCSKASIASSAEGGQTGEPDRKGEKRPVGADLELSAAFGASPAAQARAKQPSEAATPPAPAVLTIGHSTRPLEEFIGLLHAHGVTQLIDVRTVPRSRHNPQFNADTLPRDLAAAQIGYAHADGLGGFRHASADSPNSGWRNLSFRGYADYMQTPDFAANLTSVIELAQHDRVALMCAEAVPWRCHRSLIADALVARGIPVAEIASVTRLQPHKLTPFAHVEGGAVTYPPSAATA